ncbi:MFS transporter [Labrys monachus]|uniref:DHA2 family multidrug resistance protein-like MFS transporter n=1 Tax=Labrys monachus TaxID=217067 RepID=A0ABU0F6V5_9HYPH|nr:MFS transporter [Labrys monachus]MDQ0390341.1 DHA2 family multidrug resistance protein-like MFS transporter [Labrys monachus]
MNAAATDGLPNPQRALAFLTIAIALTMAVLDSAIVNVALPSIARELAIPPSDAIWVVTAYVLAVTVSLLPLASLGDILGYKRVYWCGLAVFTAASFACANAHSLVFLACARVVQGFGAAGIMSVNIALVRYIYPKAKLGVGVGYTALVVAVSSAAGPSVASAILAVAAWQWLFLVNVPLGILALFIAARFLPQTPASGHRFDALSAVLNAVTFGLLIAGLDAFSDADGHARAALMLAGAAVFGAVFVRRERRLAVPMLPVDLLRRPVFALSMATSICSFAAQNMAYIALPFYFEQALGRSETATGFLMTPWPLMTALMAPIAGHLSDRLAPERLGSAGLVVLAAGLACVATMGAEPSSFDIGWRLAICGFGFGLFQSPNNRIIIASAPRERSGGASGLQSTGRLLGQSMGAAVAAVVFGLVAHGQTALIAWIGAGLSVIGALSSGLRRTSL